MNFLVLSLLTGSRVIFGLIVYFTTLFLSPESTVILGLILIIVVSELMDALDGFLARRYDLASDFGKIFDPYADSIFRLLTYFGLVNFLLVPIWLPILMVFRDVTVAYIRIFSEMKGVTLAARITGKIKAIGQGAGSVILLILLYTETVYSSDFETFKWYVVLMVAGVTLVSLIDYSRYLLRLVKPNPSA